MRKPSKILYAIFSIVVACSLMATSTHARLTSSFDAINFEPAISNNTDFFTVYSSQTVRKHGWNAGFYIDYARHPLELGQPAGNRIFGVVDDTIILSPYGTFGILDWFSIGVTMPIVLWNNFAPNAPPPFGIGPPPVGAAGFASDSQQNLGDLRFELKFRILNNEEKLIGLALLPYIIAPTGDSLVFMGNGNVAGGIKIILDFNIHERVRLGLNVGYHFRPDVTILNARMDDQLTVGLGISIKIIERLTFIADAHMEPVIRDFFDDEVEVPAEAGGGFRIKVTDNININVGGAAGLTIGVGTPDFRAFLGMNYNWAPEPCAACDRPPSVEARSISIDQVIQFEFDKAVIRPQSYPILDDVAAIIKANPGIKRVMIEGHTDSIGSDAYNMKLSERRANSVRQYLTNKGIAPGMLDTVGYGESRPVATNDTAEGRAKNRRVEFKVVE